MRVSRPPDVAAVLGALERPGLAWAAGDIRALSGPWPERPLLLYLPGGSSRGVQVTHDGEQLSVRILAASSPADYDLAFRLLEVVGGTSLVEPEEGAPTPASEVRERFGGEWMVRDMATGVAALRASLEAGHTVSVSGPVHAVEISPEALRTSDLTRVHEILVRAQAAETDDPRDELPGLAVVIRERRIEARHGEISERVLALLGDAGAGEIADRLGDLPVATDVRYADLVTGWIADLDRRALLVLRVRDREPLPELARWEGFMISHHEDGDALAAYLGEHGLALPRHHEPDADPAWDALLAELELGRQEHRAMLEARERAAAAVKPEPRAKASSWRMVAVLLAFLVVVVPALVTRVLAIPFRGLLRARRARARVRRDQARRTALLAANARLAAAPDSLDARHDRAIAFITNGWSPEADRDLRTCLAGLDAGRPATVTRGTVLHNLSVTCAAMQLRALSAVAKREAAAAGFTLRQGTALRRASIAIANVALLVFALFAALAGLGKD